MNIVICCEDESKRLKIKGIIEKTEENYKINNPIVLCSGSSVDVLEYLNNNSVFTMYFLGTEFYQHKIDGFHLAAKIRENDWVSCIVFVTNYPDKCELSFKYKIQAIDYIVWSRCDFESRIEECLCLIQRRQANGMSNDILTFTDKFNMVSIVHDDIIFIESIPNTHKLIIHYKKGLGPCGEYLLYENLTFLEQKLGSKFFRSHKSYIINKKHIKCINKKMRTIEMSNGEICYYSRNNAKDLLKSEIC